MSLTILPVVMPRSLEGVQNGQLPSHLLEQVGPRGFLHPNAARCWRALCAEGRTRGFHLTYTYGGCYRPYADQRNLFTSRYQVTPLPGRPTKVWEGVVWYQKPQTAMAAVPGTSNHGLGLAVDAALDNDLSDGVGPNDAESIGPALPWFREAALRYGFSFEAQSEPWHIRLVVGDVVPAAVRAYEASLIQPPTIEEDDDMGVIITNAEEFFGGPAGQAKFLLLDSGKLRWIKTIEEWQARGGKPGIPWTNSQIGTAGVES